MRKANEVMSDFMKKLSAGEFDKYIIEPVEESIELTEQFVEKQVEKFDKLLKSDLVQNIVHKDEPKILIKK